MNEVFVRSTPRPMSTGQRNQHLQSIAESLAATLQNLLATTAQPPTRQCTMEEHYLNSKPICASRTQHQPTIITKVITYIMSNFLIGSHQWLILLALCTIYINNELNFLFFYCMDSYHLSKMNFTMKTIMQAYTKPLQHINK